MLTVTSSPHRDDFAFEFALSNHCDVWYPVEFGFTYAFVNGLVAVVYISPDATFNEFVRKFHSEF